MDAPEFIRRKGIGTSAEMALRNLLTSAGGIVTCNQINRDMVQTCPGAAVAHDAAGTLHLPDLSVIWPLRAAGRRMHIEAKAKTPLRRGGWGWDRHAYDRACRWGFLTGDPVLYAIRDLSEPLPATGQPDDANAWWIASTWKLAHASSRSDAGDMLYWSADEFLPLGLLLEGIYQTALVPCIYVNNGGPPLVL